MLPTAYGSLKLTSCRVVEALWLGSVGGTPWFFFWSIFVDAEDAVFILSCTVVLTFRISAVQFKAGGSRAVRISPNIFPSSFLPSYLLDSFQRGESKRRPVPQYLLVVHSRSDIPVVFCNFALKFSFCLNL